MNAFIIRTLAIAATLGLGCSVTQAGTEVYTWVDENGQVHYADTWVDGCEKMDIPHFPAPAPLAQRLPPSAFDAPAAGTPNAAQSEEPVYKGLKVVSPAEDECLRRVGGIVKVLVKIDPDLRKDQLLQDSSHRLLVNLDGNTGSDFLIGVQDGSLALFLTDVFRGTHRLEVMIEDRDGNRLAESGPVNFHVQQIAPIIRQQQREQRRRMTAPSG